MERKRIIVGLSGGVDSAVSAWLLKEQGYDVQGLFMKNWEREDYTMACTSSRDLADVRLVCDRLGIVLHTANFSEDYWEQVFTRFLEEYSAYRTPNPDILCNKVIKFKVFLEYAKQLGADAIATGHYASRGFSGSEHQLNIPKDNHKDQTYFLYTLTQQQLSQTLFPLSNLTKPEVRQLAQHIGLPNHAKKDSVGICFIGQRNFKSFLSGYLKPQPGQIRTLEDKVIGEHDGLMYYTLGQRKGLNLGGQAGYPDAPWYVVDKEVDRNILRVVQGTNHPALYKNALSFNEASWVKGDAPSMPLECYAKVRYRQVATPCTLSIDETTNTYRVTFTEAQRAITPGQAVVLYHQEHCLGGGTIGTTYTV